ncbi:sensor histidine kinase [Lacipirellula parvula]|uniref:histidine kinase n=1 Tax=Lacipirellula parvula TaxID=2650471 RepID=A0A5K7XKE3_9BACT|nr:HAMP domain-containing sensor histidine kinase [Lacipirellula parvula]BBO33389.1 sensor histidine kinase [Lacipirellula parvula]
MRLADFILSSVEPIQAEWEIFARSIGAGENLDELALRDHAGQILLATARNMKAPQTAAERAKKSKGLKPSQEDDTLDGASESHAVDRLGLGFDLLEVMSEYRALRASILRLWDESSPDESDRDVDDITRFNESIDQSITKAVASYTSRVDQARDMFLAILGHDLRNPLNSISINAQLVPLVSADPAEAIACGRQISRNVSVMERMIADLLDYTRTRLGAGMPVTPAPLDLGDLAVDLFEEFRTAHPARNIQLRTEGDLNGQWDSDRVRQAISNLLGNAIQHGSADYPVTVSLRGEASNVFIEVHNGGDPIPPGELQKIFDPLIRGSGAEHPKKNRPGSIGMGLYIAREVAKSHSGRIDVTSTAEDGTAFTIRLPRDSAPRHGQPILDAEHIDRM